MLSQISATLSHPPSHLTATTAFSFRPYFRPKSRFYPFSSQRRRFSSVVSMDGSSSPSTAASVDSISEDLKNQRFENGVDGVNNAINTDNISQNRVRLKLEELKWDNSFVRELPGDPRTDIIPREV